MSSAGNRGRNPQGAAAGAEGEDEGGGRGENVAPTFVNEGLLQWERDRKAWLGSGGGAPVGRRRLARARTMDVDEVIDDIFSGRGGSGNLPQSVPLPQMVDLLVDLWEAEGLFD